MNFIHAIELAPKLMNIIIIHRRQTRTAPKDIKWIIVGHKVTSHATLRINLSTVAECPSGNIRRPVLNY